MSPESTRVHAVLKSAPEDFRVDEIPAYLPSGQGEHLFVRFEKTRLDTERAVHALAQALGASPRDAGYAGMKDRHAVTTQWASFLVRGEPDPSRLESVEGLRVLEVARHGNKLKTGHLRGNHFVLRLRELDPSFVPLLERRLASLLATGVPAFFGVQRFGREGANIARATEWIIDGGRAPRQGFERKLLVSSLQSAIFNEVLARRIEMGAFARVLEGDLLRKEDSGGIFLAPDLTETQARLDSFEVSPTGPMVGSEMRWPEGAARQLEDDVLRGFRVTPEMLDRVRDAGAGTRRPLRMRISDARITRDEHGALVEFTLPSGGYATEVLRELTHGGAVESRPPRPAPSTTPAEDTP